MSDPLRLALFDVDGTLIDSQHVIVAAMEMAYRAHGLADPDPQAVRNIIGLSLLEAVAALLPGEELALHERVASSYKSAFIDLRQQPDHHAEPFFDGALDALAEIEAMGWMLGVATGKTNRGLEAMIERAGLHGRFLTRQTADGNPGKPHPGMILRAIDETGVEPANVVMIGDTVYDIGMAVNARVRALGVSWGYHPVEELRKAGAHAIATDYPALPALLDRVRKESACA